MKDCEICWYELDSDTCLQCGHVHKSLVFNEIDWEEFMAKRMINVSEAIASRYETYNREEFIRLMDKSIKNLAVELRASVTFGVDIESYPYDTQDYPRFFMFYERPETDVEEADREQEAAKHALLAQANERAEFERLSKLYGGSMG